MPLSVCKDTLDLLFRPPWRICPAVYVGLSLLGQIVGQGRQDHAVLGICINEHQLDLHALGKDAFDEHRRPMPHQPSQLGGGPFVMAVRLDLGEPRQIGSQLHEDPVFLHTADDPRHCLPGMEIGGVFFPGAAKLVDAGCEYSSIAKADGIINIFLTFVKRKEINYMLK